MRQRRILAAMLVVVVGCSFGDKDDSPMGDIVINFQRGGSSLLPAQADSAMVRLWDRSSGSSHTRAFAIPTDVSSSVTLHASAAVGSLYQVDVLAYHTDASGHRIALAAGETQGVTVSARQNNVLHFAILPFGGVLDGPATLTSGESATYTLTLAAAPPIEDLFSDHGTVSYAIGPDGDVQQVDVARAGSVATATFDVPTVSADTALYFQFSFDIDTTAFDSGDAPFTADVPLTLLGEPLFRRPVQAAVEGASLVR